MRASISELQDIAQVYMAVKESPLIIDHSSSYKKKIKIT
jgi:hypothetical protein